MSTGPGDVRYTKSGDYHIAYDVVGDGPIDIVHVPGILTTLEAQASYPPLARFYEQFKATGGTACAALS